jgi:ABC-type amino acid transport substrate-binding protein
LLGLLLILANPLPAASADLELHLGLAREASLPLATIDRGVLSGLAIDLGRRLTEQLGVELRLSRLPQRELVSALKGGRIDAILTTMPDVELRALRLLASAPLLQSGQMALVRQADLTRFAREIDVLSTQAKVGYERGTMAARVVHQRMPSAERVPFPDAWQALLALKGAQVDILVLDALPAWNLLANPDERELVALLKPLSSEQLVWAVREKDVHLLAQINAVIKQWEAKGTLARLIGRWIPLRIEPGN